MAELQKSDPVPDFELPDQSGAPVRLSSFHGSAVVLYFYPKDDTPGCTKEACEFRDALPDFRQLDAVVLGVSPDDAVSHAKFREKYQLPFSLLSDSDHRVAELFGAWGKKNLYGREYEGVLRTTIVIDADGRLVHVFRNVRPQGHAEQVLKVLKQ